MPRLAARSASPGMHDALHHHRAPPAVAQACKNLPGETAADILLHEGCSRLAPGTAIGDDICESGHARAQQCHAPGPGDRRLDDRGSTQSEGHAEAVAQVARPLRAGRNVQCGDKDLRARRMRARCQIEAELVVFRRERIELEPCHVRRDLGDRLDGFTGQCADPERGYCGVARPRRRAGWLRAT